MGARTPLLASAALLGALASAAPAGGGPRLPELPLHRFTLANGLEFVLVDRPGSANIAAGWVVRAGSAADLPEAPGTAHLIEHLLFKGSRSIGTRDYAAEEAHRVAAERLRAEIADHESTSAPQLSTLRLRLDEAEAAARALTISGELSLLYSEAGGGPATARTFEDFSLYTVELPAEALELWFWLESDRLLAPVVRDLRSEVEIVAEEQRQRAASEPGAEHADRVRAALWGDHPYGRPVLGDPEALRRLDRAAVAEEIERRYRPAAITAVLAGQFDRAQVEGWARRYFGRLPAGGGAPAVSAKRPGVTTPTVLELDCGDCGTQVEIAYLTSAIGSADSAALELVAGLLNGRGGRLYREWVVERGIARSAYVIQHARALGGSFRLRAEAAAGVSSATLESAWRDLVGSLSTSPPAPGELERVRARIGRESFERLKEPSQLVAELLTHHGLGQPLRLTHWASQIQTLTAADVQRTVRRQLGGEPRVVARYRRPTTAADGPRRGR